MSAIKKRVSKPAAPAEPSFKIGDQVRVYDPGSRGKLVSERILLPQVYTLTDFHHWELLFGNQQFWRISLPNEEDDIVRGVDPADVVKVDDVA